MNQTQTDTDSETCNSSQRTSTQFTQHSETGMSCHRNSITISSSHLLITSLPKLNSIQFFSFSATQFQKRFELFFLIHCTDQHHYTRPTNRKLQTNKPQTRSHTPPDKRTTDQPTKMKIISLVKYVSKLRFYLPETAERETLRVMSSSALLSLCSRRCRLRHQN